MRETLWHSSTLIALHLPFHVHLHPHGPRLDYLGVLIGAVISWAGLPGPGEAALIAAAIAAAHHHLDLTSLLALAWLGATAGGMLGWIAGLKAGRSIVKGPGPLRRHRLAVVARGDRFYARYGAVAVLFTPSWVAGIHAMRWTRYVPINAASALVWALGVGLGAYALGPPIADIVTDIGAAAWLILVAIVLAGAAVLLLRRRRRRADD